MKKGMNTINRILILTIIATTIISCGNYFESQRNTAEEYHEESIDITNCYIHIENGAIIKMNPDGTAQLIIGEITKYGSWHETWVLRAGKYEYGTEVGFGTYGELCFYFTKDDYVYYNRMDWEAKNPNRRDHYYLSKSLE